MSYSELFKDRRNGDENTIIEPESAENPEKGGLCYSPARGTNGSLHLEVRFADKPSVFLMHNLIDMPNVASETEFQITYAGRNDTYRLIVKGYRLKQLCSRILNGRVTWIRALDRDFDCDEKHVITSIEVIKVDAE